MWHLFKTGPKNKPFDFIGVDMHAHLLPGVDDGVKTFAESQNLIGGLQGLGIDKIHLTPHIYRDVYPNDKQALQKVHTVFFNELRTADIDLDVQLSAEYYLDDHFSDLLKKNELLPFGADKYVLVETSFAGLLMNLQESLFEITTSGYTPVLAHPERYHYLSAKLYKFNMLVEQGVKLQVNLPSVVGYYGRASADIFNYLLKEKLISFLGTDIHHERHLEALIKLSRNKKLLKKLRKIDLLNPTLM